MRFRASFLAFAGLAFAACASVEPPELPTVRASVHGTVRGTSVERVDYVARTLDELAAQVPLTLPGCEARPVDVRLVAEMTNANWSGATYTTATRRWMELPEGDTNLRIAATMAHELVHYLLGPDWATLPGILEEGLCDHVAHQLVPAAGALERAQYAVILGTALEGNLRFTAERIVGRGKNSTFAPELMTYTVRAPIERASMPTFEDALRYDSRDLEPIHTQGVRGTLDALGYLLVTRIGVHDLHQLCRRALVQGLVRVPPAWIFESAGLDAASPAGWRSAIDQLMGEEEKRALLRNEDLQFREAP